MKFIRIFFLLYFKLQNIVLPVYHINEKKNLLLFPSY